MTLSVTHAFVSAIADDAGAVAAGEVVPSNWNAAHALSGGTTGSILFIGAGSALTQDNSNFFWDDSLFKLKIGSGSGIPSYAIGSKSAIFVVPNVSGDNWFEGEAGNTTLTGDSNFGTGTLALSSLTTGQGNVAIGVEALRDCTAGNQNTAIGQTAMAFMISGSQNFAMGTSALGSISTGSFNVGIGSFCMPIISTGANNVAIGNTSLQGLTTATSNVSIGHGSGNHINTGSGNVAIGESALFTVTTSGDNVAIGGASLIVATGTFNVAMGSLSAKNWTTGDYNTLLGGGVLFNTPSGNHNTVVGSWEGPAVNMDNVISLTDGLSNSVLLGGARFAGVDFNYSVANVWSFSKHLNPIGMHIYNTTDTFPPPVNYERACLDWNLTSNVFRFASQAGGTGTVRLIAIDGFQKAGAPAAGDLPAGTCALINDTSGGNTWLAYNNSGTIRKVQLV